MRLFNCGLHMVSGWSLIFFPESVEYLLSLLPIASVARVGITGTTYSLSLPRYSTVYGRKIDTIEDIIS